MSEQPKIVFGNESKSISFEDLQPKLVLANEATKLIFDVAEVGNFLLVGVGEFLLINTHNSKLKI